MLLLDNEIEDVEDRRAGAALSPRDGLTPSSLVDLARQRMYIALTFYSI